MLLSSFLLHWNHVSQNPSTDPPLGQWVLVQLLHSSSDSKATRRPSSPSGRDVCWVVSWIESEEWTGKGDGKVSEDWTTPATFEKMFKNVEEQTFWTWRITCTAERTTEFTKVVCHTCNVVSSQGNWKADFHQWFHFTKNEKVFGLRSAHDTVWWYTLILKRISSPQTSWMCPCWMIQTELQLSVWRYSVRLSGSVNSKSENPSFNNHGSGNCWLFQQQTAFSPTNLSQRTLNHHKRNGDRFVCTKIYTFRLCNLILSHEILIG